MGEARDLDKDLEWAKENLREEIARLEKLPPYESDEVGIVNISTLNMAKHRLERLEQYTEEK